MWTSKLLLHSVIVFSIQVVVSVLDISRDAPQGLEFKITISKGTVCSRLQCYVNTLPEDARSILAIKIYDVTDGNVLLASLSGASLDAGEPATSPPMKLELAVTQRSNCDRGSFKCQLNYVKSDGEIDVEVVFIKADSSSGDPMKGWTLAFRGTATINKSVHYAYTNKQARDLSVEPGCKQVTSALPCTNHYRNDQVLDNWANINEVAFIVYKNNIEVRRVVFDGKGTTNLNWFSRDRIKTSSWTDLKTESANYFSIAGLLHKHFSGVNRWSRRFFMNHVLSLCTGDSGWFVAIDIETRAGCPWETYPAFPVFKYSRGDRYTNWSNGDFDVADVIAVFVR
ncbi:unnamed protein product [Lymnaea stagnalis]|uniref:Uncharacterized protein n=1 Tax=Lymnaea stagnalis TaxID=6523 RepID=A0AAV2HSK7_LYMST